MNLRAKIKSNLSFIRVHKLVLNVSDTLIDCEFRSIMDIKALG